MPEETLNILLIDDECALFTEALEGAAVNFELTCCPDVMHEVYYHLHEKDFHIIFLDINMPGDSGLVFLEKIKSHPSFEHIPIVMYTVSVHDNDIEKSYELGAHYYMVKPYAQQNFVESLKKIFQTDWTKLQPQPAIYKFVVNLAFA